jgi:hypothetical protein
MTARPNTPHSPTPRAMTDLHTEHPGQKGEHPSPRLVRKTRTPREVLRVREGKKGRAVKVVEIHWLDAIGVATGNWEDHTQINQTGAPSLAVGYLIGETPNTYTVIAVANEHHYAHGITIPKGCVTRLTVLA